MSLVQGLCFTVAFLAPLPPEWSGQGRPELPKLNWWIAGLTAWFLLAVTFMPLSLALAEHWAIQRIGASCKATGGRIALASREDRRSYRCDAAPGRSQISP
ncbi:hypothetical protein U8607_15540 [Methylobacterium durans]|uniref:hypothetical protein n=1 Tax=Methylobacterium durans TaxID=2202825 RepID=UPI002AFFE026|nr:hypothetical protein [Methylobacterium durans]MEA1833498.1 hypothetical protein [Methylobacterium durans]